MLTLAPEPRTEADEIQGQIDWLKDLLDILHDPDLAADTVKAAVGVLERQLERE